MDFLSGYGMLIHRISEIKIANYNPREISDEQYLRLKESIIKLGLIRPIVINGQNKTLIAGHQRLRAAQELGYTMIPTFETQTVFNLEDEVKFNLYHNGIEEERGCESYISPSTTEGYKILHPKNITASHVPHGAYIRSLIFKLYAQYGHFSNIVANLEGDVLCGHQYLITMQALWEPFIVYYTNNPDAKRYLNGDYGYYSFNHIKRETYNQCLAQKNRGKGENNRSTLFTEYVYKDQPIGSGLDFGAGRMFYSRLGKHSGITLQALEFYIREEGGYLNTTKTHEQIMQVIQHLLQNRYDWCVCDSVLNSVDSKEAELDVMTVCNAMITIGSTLYFSGRMLRNTRQGDYMVSYWGNDFLLCLDKEKLACYHRGGNFYFQNFHNKEDIEKLCERSGFELETWDDRVDYYLAKGKKTRELEKEAVQASILREFGLPLPNEDRYGYGDIVWKVLGKYY